MWRISRDWKTFFELTDIAGLFIDQDNSSQRYVTLYFFDSNGILFMEKRVNLVRNQRQTLDLSDFVSKSNSQLGTFCVFHSDTPEVVSDLGSFIAERGYVSYLYKGAPLRSYVHGNLDAISINPDRGMQLLGSTSFRSREYRLQHMLLGPAFYEMAIVNCTARQQRVACKLLSMHSGGPADVQVAKISPRGAHVFPLKVGPGQSGRVVIKSRLVMARPVVYRIQKQSMDVFHG